MRILALVLIMLATPAPAQSWQPSEQQKSDVLEAVNAYFAAIDAGDYRSAFQAFAPSFRSRHSESDFRKLYILNITRFGPVARRVVQGVTWYPKRSREGTGVGAAVDFHGLTKRGDLVCGYVAMIELEDGRFVAIRDDTSYVEVTSAKTMSPEQRLETFDRPGCRLFLKKLGAQQK